MLFNVLLSFTRDRACVLFQNVDRDCFSSNYSALLFFFFIFRHQRSKTPLTRSDSGNSDDNYVPMNPGSSPLSAAQADSPKNIYIPMSPGPHHFDFPGFSATLPTRKGSCASLCHRPSRLSDVTPPPINRNLKPNRKCEFFDNKSCQCSPVNAFFSFYFTIICENLSIVKCVKTFLPVFYSETNTSRFEEQWDH